jgi:S1-C subfamily serine protease
VRQEENIVNHAAHKWVIHTLLWIIPQIAFVTHALPKTVHDKVHPSLVFLKATALGAASAGPKEAGVPRASLATGVLVSKDGLVLTVYHYLTELGNYDPETLRMHASVSKQEDNPSIDVSLIEADPTVDLLLLKLHVENPPTPKVEVAHTLPRSDDELIYSSGYLADQGYITSEGKITARQGPKGSLYATSLTFGHGQSGSPVYDKDARLIGIAKGTLTSQGSVNYFIPIDYAERLLVQTRMPEITQFIDKLTQSGDFDPVALNKRVKEIEEGIQTLRERVVWKAEINPVAQNVTLTYDKLLSGEPHPSQIKVKITPIGSKIALPPLEPGEMTFDVKTPFEADSGTFVLDNVFAALEGTSKAYSFKGVQFALIPKLSNGRELKPENITIGYSGR